MKHLYSWSIVALLIFTLVLPTACTRAAASPLPLTVDTLKNVEYRSDWPSEGVARLTDGQYQEEIVPGAASKVIVALYPDMYAFGDLNGDGLDDAAVFLAASGGGSGTFITLEAVVNDQGTPQHIASADLGDRTQIKAVTIKDGKIIVDMIVHSPDDPMCCPTQHLVQTYTLQEQQLVKVTD